MKNRFFREQEGGSLVETALSCLILIPVLFGIIQLSMALYCYHFAADAAREATRFAVVRGGRCNDYFGPSYCSPTDKITTGATQNDIAQYVKTLGYPYSASAVVAVQWCSPASSKTITCSTTKNNSLNNQVQVKVTYVYPLVIPYLKTNTLNIGSTSSMTIVQ
jgi:Flp pilus assembly protein TadG